MARADDPLSILVRAQLRSRLYRLGLLQNQLAARAGISQEYLSRILNGRQRVHVDLARALLAEVGLRLVVGVEDIEADNIEAGG